MPWPPTGPIAPALERWRKQAGSESERTVIIRTSPCDPTSLAHALTEAGAHVRSVGASVSTVRVRPDSLDRVAKVNGVIAIEEPRELFPRVGFREL